MSLNFSYLSKKDIAYLTKRMVEAAQEVNKRLEEDKKRNELRRKLRVLQNRLALLEGEYPTERVAELRERLERLNRAIQGL
ncbi:hypothetical protein DRJ48_04390 [Candidatus Woesearchaeota archaeon]|nr:MAG: hypothetical protein DRJ48_04390 [Candidatus Woesearchaeota archaeon]